MRRSARIIVPGLVLGLLVAGCGEKRTEHPAPQTETAVPARATEAVAAAPPLQSPSPPQEREESRPSLIVTGEVWRGTYSSMVGSGFDIEYRVSVTVTNTGSDRVQFDLVEGAFSPEHGKTLRMGQRWRDKSHQPGGGADEQGVNQELSPGSHRIVEFKSDGYTSMLLRDAAGGRLRFSVVLQRNGTPVTSTFVAELPAPQGLPEADEVPGRAGPPGATLVFKEVRR